MMKDQYPHYHKEVPLGVTHVDVYRVLRMFKVTDPSIAHAVKKLLVAGGRGTKDAEKDVAEAIASLERFQEMQAEEATSDDAKEEIARQVDKALETGVNRSGRMAVSKKNPAVKRRGS